MITKALQKKCIRDLFGIHVGQEGTPPPIQKEHLHLWNFPELIGIWDRLQSINSSAAMPCLPFVCET